MVTIQTDLTQFNEDLALYAKLARKTLQEATLKQGMKVMREWRFALKEIAPPKDVIRNAMLRHLKAGRGIYVRPSAYRRAEDSLGRKKGAYSDLITRKIMYQAKGGSRVATRGKMRSDGTKYQLNRQAIAVMNELGMRERARGFSSYGASMREGMSTGGEYSSLDALVNSIPSNDSRGKWIKQFVGKVKQHLSTAEISVDGNGDSAFMRLIFGSPETALGESLSLGPQQALLRKSIASVHDDMMAYVTDRLARAKANPKSIYAIALRAT